MTRHDGNRRDPARPPTEGRSSRRLGSGVLDRRGHALVDYLTAPSLLLLSHRLQHSASGARVFVALILLAVTTTRTPLGVWRVVPFRWHGRTELASVFVQAALPWLVQRWWSERTFWWAFAAYNLAVWLGTDWRDGDD